MKKERVVEVLTDLSAWINGDRSLYWSASEIGLAIHFAELEIDSILAAKVLHDYRDWLEFGQPLCYTLNNLSDALNIAIETLQSNKKQHQ